MSELQAPWKYVISFNPHFPLKTVSVGFFPPILSMLVSQVEQWWSIYLSMQETQEMWVQSLGQEIPWRREWLPTPVFLPRKFHGQRSLGSSSLWGGKELDMTEWLTHTQTHTHTHCARMYLTFILSMGKIRPRNSSRSDDSKVLIGEANPVSLILVPIISKSC